MEIAHDKIFRHYLGNDVNFLAQNVHKGFALRNHITKSHGHEDERTPNNKSSIQHK